MRYRHLTMSLLGALLCQASDSVAGGDSPPAPSELLSANSPLVLTDRAPTARVPLPARLLPSEGDTIQMALGKIDNPQRQGVMVCTSLLPESSSAAIALGCIGIFPATAGGQYSLTLRNVQDQLKSKSMASSQPLALSLQLKPVDEHAALAPLRVQIDSLLWKRD